MNLRNTFRKYQQKYYAPGSPLRYVRKAVLEVTNPGSGSRRSRLGNAVAKDLPADLQQRMTDLGATGFADGGNEIDPGTLAELNQTVGAKLASGFEGTRIHDFFTNMTSPEDLQSDSIYVRFALQPAMQKLVCAYFGNTVPYLGEIALIRSNGTDGKWSKSQLWHLDYADSHTLLLWVYLTDVPSIEDGPFTYIPAKASSKVPNGFFPDRVTDETMDAAGLTSAACRVYGPKNKVFYVDTSRCYHLGSRVYPGHERLVYLATFITHKPLYPITNGIRLVGEPSEVEKCFLTL